MEKIKELVGGLLAIGAAIFAALFYREKAKRAEDKAESLEDENEALSRVSEALIASEVKRDEDIERAKKKPVDRSHFGKSRKLH